MTSSFPGLNWAKQTISKDGKVEILDCDGVTHKFKSIDESVYWLLEDEYTDYTKIDSQDEKEYGINLAGLSPPIDHKYYVKNT